jgi:serralysin
VGGKDDDVVAGEDGNDIVYGNLGSDTVDGGAGDDVVRGGQDNDWIDAGAGADWLSGDRGSDTLIGGAGADIFHTFADAGLDRVLDFSRAQGDRVMVDPGTHYSVAQTGADVTISMVGGGQMVLAGVQLSTLTGDWIFGA